MKLILNVILFFAILIGALTAYVLVMQAREQEIRLEFLETVEYCNTHPLTPDCE